MHRKQPARRTYVVTLAGTKGGTGKTTLASALSVRAAEDSPKVALIDLDPQESLS
jgi:chromosome partitioning protein